MELSVRLARSEMNSMPSELMAPHVLIARMMRRMGFTLLITVKSSQVSQSVSFFTVPPRAHPSTGSQSGSATPGLTQVPSTRSRGLLNCRK